MSGISRNERTLFQPMPFMPMAPSRMWSLGATLLANPRTVSGSAAAVNIVDDCFRKLLREEGMARLWKVMR